jgi:Ca2+-binding RTX toxin-like protein
LTNVDSILDFAAGTDKIDLAHTIFSSLSAGTLSSSAFFVGAAAQNSSEHVIYNPGTGGLFYDPDGNGAAAATQFAKLSPGLALHKHGFCRGVTAELFGSVDWRSNMDRD